MNPTIALLTDFGTSDIYVGVMKGVMQNICPDAHFIDISHAIQPQNVREAAFALMNSYPFFGENIIFLAVVDPGVGSARKPVAVRAGNRTFVCPDNGLLTYTLSDLGDEVRAVELNNKQYQLATISSTFHGRDIFATAAAYLASGVPIGAFGPTCETLKSLPMPELSTQGNMVTGEILHIDHFGNIVTSIGLLKWVSSERMTLVPRFGESRTPVPIYAPDAIISVHDETVTGIQHAYHEGVRGELMMLASSNDFLEIAINQGSAAQRLDVRPGDLVTLKLAGSEPGSGG